MSRFARTVHIAAPSAGVWAVMMDIEAWPTWASQFKSLTLLDHGPLALTPIDQGTDAEFWLEATGALGALLSPVLRRTVFSRNTRNATEGLKRHVEARHPK